MDGSIRLSAAQRKSLLATLRSRAGNEVRRALIVLLSADGKSYRWINEALYVAFDTIATVRGDWSSGEAAEASETKAAEKPIPWWQVRVTQWASLQTPEQFGFHRTRWSCEMLSLLLRERDGIERSAETVRRGLRRLGFVWRRPRPVVGPKDPDYETKVRRIKRFLRSLPADETAVFEDEVDVHLNPKIGSCWMIRGEQAEVVTPGNNEKRHLAGSLVWRTGTLVVSPPGTRRNAALFVAHLDDLRRRFRSSRLVHVVCDNARFHDCRAVRDYLARWPQRLRLHFLPKYAPETNPIERIWWRLHETVTRNHRAPTIDALLKNVDEWIADQGSFYFTAQHPFAVAA
jgi:transposase